MRSERGFTLMEILVAVALIGIISGMTIPKYSSSNQINTLWTNSERIGALIRQTRLKAISQNSTYEVRLSCPAAGDVRALKFQDDPDVDTDPNRCSMNLD